VTPWEDRRGSIGKEGINLKRERATTTEKVALRGGSRGTPQEKAF